MPRVDYQGKKRWQHESHVESIGSLGISSNFMRQISEASTFQGRARDGVLL